MNDYMYDLGVQAEMEKSMGMRRRREWSKRRAARE